MGHEELQELLVDFVAARLSPDQRRFVEGHLVDCAGCEETVADLREIEGQIVETGDAMFAPHPEPDALRRSASLATALDPATRRHLEICASCRLEAEVWARRGASSFAPRRMNSGTGPVFRMAPAMAAAAVAGAFIGALVFRSWTAIVAPRAGRSPALVSSAVNLGQPVLRILPATLRGGGRPSQEWTLDPADAYIAVAVPLALPAQADGLYRFELRRAGASAVWSLDMPARRIREHLDSAEVVNLPAIPTGILAPGVYEIIVRPAATPVAPPLYEATITITYRQSPADTNAPQ